MTRPVRVGKVRATRAKRVRCARCARVYNVLFININLMYLKDFLRKLKKSGAGGGIV